LRTVYRKYSGKITHIIVRAVIHSSFCVLNFPLSTSRTNFEKVACTIYKVYQTFFSRCSDCELTWLMWNNFILKWNEGEVSYGEVLGDKSAMYTRVNLYWSYLFIFWLFHLDISCTVFVLTCTVVVLTSFVLCVYVGFVMCGCFGNLYLLVLYCLYCVFCIVSFLYIYSYLFFLY